ncbi:hypothetical protein QYF36_021229 [Acer negundo]|nr:hypothetical protein QYF36_021229 [Acer negundo]
MKTVFTTNLAIQKFEREEGSPSRATYAAKLRIRSSVRQDRDPDSYPSATSGRPFKGVGSGSPEARSEIRSRSVGPTPFEGGWPAPPVLLSQTRTTLNVKEDKGRPPGRTGRRDIVIWNQRSWRDGHRDFIERDRMRSPGTSNDGYWELASEEIVGGVLLCRDEGSS